MTRTDPYENKTGAVYWDRSFRPDGQKALSMLLAELRKNPEECLTQAGFPAPKSNKVFHIDDAISAGLPFAATLHDHVDYTTLHVRWWTNYAEYYCDYKVTTFFDGMGAPDLDFQRGETYCLPCHAGMGESARQVAQKEAIGYLMQRILPCPLADERVDLWWSLTGRTDQTMFHWALMPESNTWMQV